MLIYNPTLKAKAKCLRKNMTQSEQYLWYNLRRKQLLNVQFYRQKPIGSYIVDFYAPAVKLVVEVDGAQHFEEYQKMYDKQRTIFLESQGLNVLRFTNKEVLQATKSVVEVILNAIEGSKIWLISLKSPLRPPFVKGGNLTRKIFSNRLLQWSAIAPLDIQIFS